jgi:hypothetical protein
MKYRGYTKLEMLVAATLLTTMFAIASPLFARLNQVWHSTRWYQLASQELMNQMEAITQLSREECDQAVQQLAIAPEILAAIPGAELSGKLESSKDGDRVVLSFQLPASVRSEPIVLVGWLHGEVQNSEVQNSKGLDSETLDRGVMP